MNSLLLFAQTAPDNVGAGGLLAGGACMIVAVLIGIVSLVLWVWALIDAIQNPALDSTQRIIWILVIIFTSPIGPIIYLLIGRKKT